MPADIQSPVVTELDEIDPDWIDRNGHMSAVYYNFAFRPPLRDLFDHIGYDDDYRRRTGHGIFMLEWRVQYVREVLQGMALRFEGRLLDMSDKVLHYCIEMYAGPEQYLASVAEAVEIEVSLETRKPVAFEAEQVRHLKAVLAEHRKLPSAHNVSRALGIRRREDS